jgi:hypothetical protein
MYVFLYYNFIFYSSAKPDNIPRIMQRRFALTSTAHKYLEMGIGVVGRGNLGCMSFVELILGDNRGNRMVLAHETWTTLIEKREAVQRFLQSASIDSSLSIQDLLIQFVKMYDENIVKLTLRDTFLYMKPSTILFLLNLEHCVEHEYVKLCRCMKEVNEKFDELAYSVQGNTFSAEKDEMFKILRDVYDKTSVIDCELVAYAADELRRDVLRRGDWH